MLHIDLKTCKKCGKPYVKRSGGIVPDVKDFWLYDLCPVCEAKKKKEKLRKLFDIMAK